jgi:cell division septation protein DedD
MKLLKIVILGGLVISLLVGCSDEAKDEAAQLEEELQQMEGETDSTAQAMTDTTMGAEETPVADASAVPEEEQPGVAAMPPAPTGDGFTVQVASCESREYASHLVDVYFGRGYEAFVSRAMVDGQTYYRVRIGNLQTYGEAKALKLELADRYSIEPWISRLNQ